MQEFMSFFFIFLLRMSKKSSTFAPEKEKNPFTVKRFFYIVIGLCTLLMSAQAEDKFAFEQNRNELRVGWGDQLFESLVWHNPTSFVCTLPESFEKMYHEDYHYDQHVWLEYQRRFAYWFSIGLMMDWSDVRWTDVTRNGQGNEVAREGGHWFYNLVLMPTIRFTYFHHDYVNIYSGLGFGMGINGGSETNAKGKKTDVGAALNLTVLGVSANYDRWFMAVDFGGLYSLKNTNAIFLASSRMINVSIGARF